jgi:alpha-1,6-mannosyltransferase
MHISDITMFWTPSSGGVRTYLEAKDAWLAHQAGIRHTLLVPGPAAARAGICTTLPAPPLPFGHGYRFPLRRQAWIEQLVQLAPDIIEAGDPYLLAWAALAAGRRLQVPVVGFYHSDLPRRVGTRAGQWSNRWLNAYITRLYRQFDRVLAPSQVMADKLRGLGVHRVRVQPLGVDLVQFNPRHRDAAVRRELGVDDATRLLIFAGRGAYEKNLPLLLQAMTRLGRGFHLHLVGSGLPHRLPDNVSKTDRFVDRGGLARWLAGSDALVHAGDRETFGLVVLEAMASGIPVVGVQAGAVAELVVPGTGLLARPCSAESLADTVRALFADDWREMGRQARQHVEQHYGWEQVLLRLLGHYRELTGQQPEIPEARLD